MNEDISSTDPDFNAEVDVKVAAIFHELVGDRASRLEGSHFNKDTAAAIASALALGPNDRTAEKIAFHLTDWAWNAAFIVALQLFPERFTRDEIIDGIGGFLLEVPSHVAAAAALND